MEELANQRCVACQPGAPLVTPEQMEVLLPMIPEWKVLEVEGVNQIQREYEFEDFKNALVFANNVGEAAEAEFHHPSILVEWGKVTVRWWTHKIGGLHRADFIMAARTDKIYKD